MKAITLSSFWQFSLALYKYDVVQTTLIYLQNNYGANVNLALLCAMLNKHNVFLSKPQLLTLLQEVSDFSTQFTQPLRILRGTYKTSQGDINEYSQIRQNLLDTELLFEQQEQKILITQLNKLLMQHTQTISSSSDNLALYQTLLTDKPQSPKSEKANLTDLNQYLP